MFGLWIAGKADAGVEDMLRAQLIPFCGFTEEAAGFNAWQDREDFLRQTSACILRGMPLPMAGVMEHLRGPEAFPGNIIRQYVCLQLSLLPYLRTHGQVQDIPGGFLLGDELAVLPIDVEGHIDAALPEGTWTELTAGETFRGQVRRIRRLNAMPVLARENSLIPIGVENQRTDGDDADRITLHWFQPRAEAGCTLADGTWYQVRWENGKATGECNTGKPWHLIIRQGGNAEVAW